ncbi:MAG: c-type cytochrome [Flavobacteriales bacterium]
MVGSNLKNMRTLISFVFISCLVVALSRCGGGEKPEEKISGKTIYSHQCTLCHGSNGDLGASGASPLSISKLDLKQRIEVITNGRGKMMPYSGLITEAEIKVVAEYLETLKK